MSMTVVNDLVDQTVGNPRSDLAPRYLALLAEYRGLAHHIIANRHCSRDELYSILRRYDLTNGASPTNGQRRTRSAMAEIRWAILDLLQADHPMTVRQVFYRLVSVGIIDKTEAEYKRTVCRLLTEMRLDGVIPFGWIADNTRWIRKPTTFGSVEQALKRTAETYRRALWEAQDTYVEVWLEKEALAGVLVLETDPYDVPLMVTRGYPSLSYVHEAAQAIAEQDKPAVILYFGDHDPSGVDIERNVLDRLEEFTDWADVRVERIAVTRQQIEAMDLPTRPTKVSDSRSRRFVGESIEVDAIPPATLRQLCREAIEGYIDPNALDVVRVAEQSERETLLCFAEAATA
jgi:hypothetical protein